MLSRNPGRQSLRGQSTHGKSLEKYRLPVRVAMETTCRTCSWVHTLPPTPTHSYIDNYRHCTQGIMAIIGSNCLENLFDFYGMRERLNN